MAVIENGNSGCNMPNGHVDSNGAEALSEGSAQHIALLDQALKSQQEKLQLYNRNLESMKDEVRQKQDEAIHVVAETSDVVERLQRELNKSQQANEAFSKALREIGAIVTAGKMLPIY